MLATFFAHNENKKRGQTIERILGINYNDVAYVIESYSDTNNQYQDDPKLYRNNRFERVYIEKEPEWASEGDVILHTAYDKNGRAIFTIIWGELKYMDGVVWDSFVFLKKGAYNAEPYERFGPYLWHRE